MAYAPALDLTTLFEVISGLAVPTTFCIVWAGGGPEGWGGLVSGLTGKYPLCAARFFMGILLEILCFAECCTCLLLFMNRRLPKGFKGWVQGCCHLLEACCSILVPCL